jgi:hypothetical protein
MSAFVVDNSTISRVVTFFQHSRYFGPVVAGYDLRQANDRHALGFVMHSMNVSAVGQRYLGYLGEVVPYKFSYEFGSTFAALKSLECWIYQCSEGDIPERQLYKDMKELSAQLAMSIVSELPEYKSAPWN